MLQTNEITFIPNSTAIALGIFNGIHRGHTKIISTAVKCGGDIVVFSLKNSNKKGGKLLTQSMRTNILERMGVNTLLEPDFEQLRSLSPSEFVSDILKATLNAQNVVCGFNYLFGKGAQGTPELLCELCAKQGITAHVLPPVEEDGAAVSSSRIIALLQNGDVKAANRLLGRPFCYDYEVQYGNQVGRLMGTPTFNQHFEPDFCIPKFGVYASIVRYEGALYSAVTNIGIKPTVGSAFPLSETWIPNFNADLYGKRVEVFLQEFLRDEARFSGIDLLREAILKDAERALEIFNAASPKALL
ncbi:MAG: riboflavin biosynthesis protein RibF [Oscillospiraceae bacterium]|nr:riboflavin biosynthesis protein RibF [Oscillospiraceae bacterium]